MGSKTQRWLKPLLVCASLLLTALIALHAVYPLPYVARVLVYGNEGYPDDVAVPLADIPASDRPRPLPRALDARVEQALAQFQGIDNVPAFLDASGTTALMVIARGQVVTERYLRGRDAQSRERTYSVSKAVLSALAGVAMQDGLLNLDAPVTRYVPELAARDEAFAQVRVLDLLNMRSGIAYTPGLAFPFLNADDALLYYHPDTESTVLHHMDIAEPPGAFHYHQYNSALLGLILRRATGTSIASYLHSALWAPMGSESPAQWVTDDRGFEVMASGLLATPRDLAKLGLLYLDRGRVDGRALLPASWATPSEPVLATADVDTGSRPYRNGWWLVPRTGGAVDFSATGSYGQYLYVSLQNTVVIVRTGVSRGGWNDDQWFALFAHLADAL